MRRLALFADALEEAGCTHATVAVHFIPFWLTFFSMRKRGTLQGCST
jgi:hypothetical protein